MKVAMIQMEVIPGAIEQNRSHGLELARQVANQADVLVFPEVWTTGYSLGNIEEKAEHIDGPTISQLREVAQKYHVNVIAGSIPLKLVDKIYNAAVIIDTKGDVIAHYEKMHLFSFTNEARFFSSGQGLCQFELNQVPSGIAICYDLRFPEIFRMMALQGAKVIYLPAEWPTVRNENWRVLCQARAIENQLFICAVNCVGDFKGNPFYGHSLLIAPSGKILAEGTDEEQIVIADIDMQIFDKVRNSMSVFADRRSELYQL